jgi:hypothetical protein
MNALSNTEMLQLGAILIVSFAVGWPGMFFKFLYIGLIAAALSVFSPTVAALLIVAWWLDQNWARSKKGDR